ncbi:MAG: [LysW]-aminoadipate/[LysW]-glutamate kinase [Nitrososphaerota archaeon]|nr:[LysW]-aminoadipate/[LysW]-glutamate kinase [Nitrososphaerota archaeon]
MTVVKVGGSLVSEGKLENVLSDVPAALGIDRMVLVHGGGQAVTDVAERMGKKQRFITSPSGVRSRYTDRETAEIYSMVMSGMVAKKIVTGLARHGVSAFSLSGLDGSTIRAQRKKKLLMIDERNRKVAIEGGYTGRVTGVDVSAINSLLEIGFLPVVSPVAMGEEYEILNIDGDRAASATAAALAADRLLFLTNVEGVMMDGKVVERLTPSEARALLPKIGAGMDKKVMGAIEAVEGGVKACIISSGSRPNPVSTTLKAQGGTVISR